MNQAQAVRIDVVDDEYEIVPDRVHDARSTNRYLRMTSEQTEVLAQTGVIPVYESEQYGKSDAFIDISNVSDGLNQNRNTFYDQSNLQSPVADYYEAENRQYSYNQQNYTNNNPKGNTGLVVGIVAGSVILIAIIIALLIFI